MNNYFKVLNEKLNKRFGNSNLLEDNEVELELVNINMKDVEKRFLELFALALYGSSRVVGNVVYHIEEEFYNRENSFIRKGLYAIYEYIPEDNNLFKIVEFKVKEGKEEETHQIGKQPLSYFTDGIVDTYRSFSEVIDNVNSRGQNWFWNGFSSEEQEQEFRELLAIIEPKTSLREEESQDDEIMLEPITSSDITEGSTKMVSDGKWEVWKPNSESAMINLSQGTKWLSGGRGWYGRETQYDEISEESWDLKNWDKALVIINKNKIENKFLFQRGWGGMYSPSFARYSMATWLIKQNSPALLKWFAEEKLPYVSKRLKAKLDMERVEKSGGVYNYPEGGELPWAERDSVTKVIIAPGTTKIKSRAFSNFKNVKEIELPDAITSIGEYAFGAMDSLESIKLPSKLRKIADNAFYQCLSLTQVIIPNGVTEIGRSAFGSCQNLETLFIPNSVTKVDQIVQSWQRQQPELLTIYCEAKERPAGWDENFNSLTHDRSWDRDTGKTTEERTSAPVVWGASRPNVSEGLNEANGEDEVQLDVVGVKNPLLFSDENWEVYFPTTYEIYKEFDNLFSYSKQYTEEQFYKEKPKYYYILNKNNDEKYLYSPNEKRGIWYNVADSNKWVIRADNRNYNDSGEKSLEDFLADANSEGLLNWFSKKRPSLDSSMVRYKMDAIKKVNAVRNNTTLIYPDNADLLKNNLVKAEIKKTITKVIIKEGVTSIEKGLFSGFAKITDIEFPKSLKKIGSKAFENCKGIKKLIFPENLVFIGSSAFNGEELDVVFIPKSVLFIGESALSASWSKTTTFYCEATEQPEYWDDEWKGSYSGSKVIWGASRQSISESVEDGELEAIDIQEDVLYEDERWKAFRPLNLAALIDFSSDTDLIDNIRFRDSIGKRPFDANSPLVTNFDEFKKEAYLFHDKQENIKYMYLPEEWGWNLIYKGMQKNIMSKWLDMEEFIVFLSMTPGFRRFIITKFPHVKNQQFFEEIEGDVDLVGDPEVVFTLTSQPNYTRPTADEREVITKAIIDKSVTTVQSNTFMGCINLKEVVFHDEITHIDDLAFAECEKLELTKLPPKLVRIGGEAFRNCKSIKEITIPATVSYIGSGAFVGTDNLKKFHMEDPSSISDLSARSSWHWADGLYWHKLDINFPNPNLRINRRYIPLEEEDASDLLSTDTPDLEVIDDKKILYKDEEWEVVRPLTFGSMIDLGSGTTWFNNEWYRHPDSEENFQERKGVVYYFIINKKNPKIKYMMSPRNLGKDRIRYYDDTGITSLSRFLNKVKTTRGLQNWFKKTFKGLKWDVERHQQIEDELISINYTYIYPETEMKSWGYESLIEKVIIKEGTESIKDGAFSSFSKVKEIKIPGSVKTIGKHAFRSCQSLESIEIPEGVTKIEKETFWGCGRLKSVKLPKSLQVIDNQAFWGCDDLETIELPQGLTTIESAAFLGCHTLSNVFIPISVKTVGSQAFEVRNSVHNQTPAIIMCEAPEKPSGWDDDWTEVEHVEVKWNVSK